MKIIIYHSKENLFRKRMQQNLRFHLFSFFLMNIYVNETYFFFSFHHITQYLSYLNQLDFDFDYTVLKYNH